MNYVSHSPEDTQLFAREEAWRLTRELEGEPIVIVLEGELGAGKTTFAQAFAEALGVRDHIKSPTFVVMKNYHIDGTPGYKEFYHLDCYRLNEASDLIKLGGEEIMYEPGNIVLIEWAERVSAILPEKHLVVHIDHIAEHKRNINTHLTP
ncbi:MAG: tRNA (adenosine(37)-N6)-threonylcarbamoyltransferase complex ATPase subunit type 1 TsaE [Patescibacteria group bacterium]